MFAFIFRRLLLMIPTTIGIALVVFIIYHAAPGDPATVMMGAGGGGQMGTNSDVEAKIEAFRRKHGLDRALAVQFLDYIGPFNLSRDGHAWFSSPYSEREVVDDEIEPGDGSSGGRPPVTVPAAKPLAIDYLPGTPDARRIELDALSSILVDERAGPDEWERAATELAAGGQEALPALFTALYELRLELVSSVAAIDRVSSALERSTGFHAAPHPSLVEKRGKLALIREWFRWYYQEGGGSRVQNTGQRPWGGLLCFDLGVEMQSKQAVGPELWKRLKVTVPISLMAVFLSYMIALPLGIFSVQKQGTRIDGALTIVLFILYSIPTFWAGLMLILAFGKTGMDLLPVLGLHDKDADSMGTWAYLWDLAKHLVLPLTAYTYGSLAYLSRQMRAGMLDVIRQDYIRTARAKGLSERVVIYKHALRNSMIPIATNFGHQVSVLIMGSFLIEKIFDIDGFGLLGFTSVLDRDYPVVMGVLFLGAVLMLLGNILSDILVALVDPRVRFK